MRSIPSIQRGVKPNRIVEVFLSAIGDPRGGIVCSTRQVKANESPRDTVSGLHAVSLR